MKVYQLKPGVWIRHKAQAKYVKAIEFTLLGNVVHVVLRNGDGRLEHAELLLNDDVEMAQ